MSNSHLTFQTQTTSPQPLYALINLNLFQNHPKNVTTLLKLSKKIHSKIYQHFLAQEDIFQLSSEYTFLFLSPYLKYPKSISPQNFLNKIITEITNVTHLTPFSAIGTNPFLAKTALDFHLPFLDEQKFKHLLWPHRPLSDFWGFTPEITAILAENNVLCPGDLARLVLKTPKIKAPDPNSPQKTVQISAGHHFLLQTFGPTAELLINHAFGQTSLTLQDFQTYAKTQKSHRKITSTSLRQSQTFHPPIPPPLARLQLASLTRKLVQTLIRQRLKTNQITLNITYADQTTQTATTQPQNHQNHPCFSTSPQTLIQTTLKLYDQKIYSTAKITKSPNAARTTRTPKSQNIQELALTFGNLRN